MAFGGGVCGRTLVSVPVVASVCPAELPGQWQGTTRQPSCVLSCFSFVWGPFVPAQKSGEEQKPDTLVYEPPDGLLCRRGRLWAPVNVASTLVEYSATTSVRSELFFLCACCFHQLRENTEWGKTRYTADGPDHW